MTTEQRVVLLHDHHDQNIWSRRILSICVGKNAKFGQWASRCLQAEPILVTNWRHELIKLSWKEKSVDIPASKWELVVYAWNLSVKSNLRSKKKVAWLAIRLPAKFCGSTIIPIFDWQAEWLSETHQRHSDAIVTTVSLELPPTDIEDVQSALWVRFSFVMMNELIKQIYVDSDRWILLSLPNIVDPNVSFLSSLVAAARFHLLAHFTYSFF